MQEIRRTLTGPFTPSRRLGNLPITDASQSSKAPTPDVAPSRDRINFSQAQAGAKGLAPSSATSKAPADRQELEAILSRGREIQARNTGAAPEAKPIGGSPGTSTGITFVHADLASRSQAEALLVNERSGGSHRREGGQAGSPSPASGRPSGTRPASGNKSAPGTIQA